MVLNVALFVPLAMFVRHMFGRGAAVTAGIGLAVSLLIEVTQLTGVWFLYPCAYRLFDVDDLMANGLGALAGALAGPVLRAVPGQRTGSTTPAHPSRRLLEAVCDLLIFKLSSVLVSTSGTVLVLAVHGELFRSGGRNIEQQAGYQGRSSSVSGCRGSCSRSHFRWEAVRTASGSASSSCERSPKTGARRAPGRGSCAA
ncbi:VanZ family protein [Saccharopolyspora sp. NPDC000359]|uniref:VanZ family protein n=1 Tax=Saccharopolyspora sp. NPDC000359 TaxID=3154251 RepID=UPI0033266224